MDSQAAFFFATPKTQGSRVLGEASTRPLGYTKSKDSRAPGKLRGFPDGSWEGSWEEQIVLFLKEIKIYFEE